MGRQRAVLHVLGGVVLRVYTPEAKGYTPPSLKGIYPRAPGVYTPKAKGYTPPSPRGIYPRSQGVYTPEAKGYEPPEANPV